MVLKIWMNEFQVLQSWVYFVFIQWNNNRELLDTGFNFNFENVI